MMIKMLLPFLVSVSLFADFTWDGRAYHDHSTSQQQAALNLCQALSFNGNEAILDVGCGDGKITQYLSDLVPQGYVVGIDLSSSQIEFAKKFSSDRLRFEVGDMQELSYDQVFDLATVFTSIQWAENQPKTLQAIHRSLKNRGKLLITMPVGITWQLSEAVREVISRDSWKAFPFRDKQYFFSRESYATLLRQAGFTINNFIILPHFRTFASKEAFVNFVKQWLPFLQDVPLELRDALMDQIADVYLKLSPPKPSGEVIFELYVYNVVATS